MNHRPVEEPGDTEDPASPGMCALLAGAEGALVLGVDPRRGRRALAGLQV